MKTRPSVLLPAWKRGLQTFGLGMAKLAGYEAARPTRTRKQYGRYNTNPNSVSAQIERVQMQWDAEYIAKNVPLGTGYLSKRINYCSSLLKYSADTGDAGLNAEVNAAVEEYMEEGGMNCSTQEAFSRVADVEQPVRGDSALIWYRDETQYRLMEAAADQIGELYQFTRPQRNYTSGLIYFAGMYFYPNGQRAAMKVYERGFNQVYTNPQNYEADDILYFQDNMFRAVRGVTKFHGAIIIFTKSDQLFGFGMDSAARQAKTAVVVFNEQGQADEASYDEEQYTDGEVVYAERNNDGAVVEFKYKGDGYQVTNAQSPGEELIEGCRYADERGALALGMPYSFLVNARDVGGAPSRFEINIATKEINRITGKHKRPLKKISYVSIMDMVDKKKLPPHPLITRGNWNFPTVPSSDAFRDTKEDILARRAGIETKRRILGRYNENEAEVLRENTEDAIAVAKAVQDANRKLVADGYEPTITINSISQDSDNPQQAATADAIETGEAKPTIPGVQPQTAKGQARMSAYVDDVLVSSLPQTTQDAISKSLGRDASGLKVIKYQSTAKELLNKADPHNYESAIKRIKYNSGVASASEVNNDPEKHILLMNDRILDGHHFLAKAIKGGVTKSLPVIDLTPARFQK